MNEETNKVFKGEKATQQICSCPIMTESDCVDYDKAAAELFKELGIDPEAPCEEDCLNPVYKNVSGGVVYVGDQRAAKNSRILDRLNIHSVVNCTHNMKNWHSDKYRYLNFPVGKWKQFCAAGEKDLKEFLCPLFSFLEDNLQSGGSILLHCLAGAHRAGITGVLALMYFNKIPAQEVAIILNYF